MTVQNQVRHRTRTYGKYLRGLLTLSDFAVLNLTLLLAMIICGEHVAQSRMPLFVVINGMLAVVAMYYSVMHDERLFFIDRSLLLAARVSVGVGVGSAGVAYIADVTGVSGMCFAVWTALFFTGLSLWRFVAQRLLKYLRFKGYNYLRVLIVGQSGLADKLAVELSKEKNRGYRIEKILPVTSGEPIQKIVDAISDLNIDMVCLAGTIAVDDMERLMDAAMKNGAEFFFMPSEAVLHPLLENAEIGGIVALRHAASPLQKRISRIGKHLSDIIFSIPGLAVFLIVLIPVAVAIKRSSPGPVFFKQKRTGIFGREFTCLKFRTMRENGESDSRQAMPDDDRVTGIGKFLRRTSIDELPQFLNVLKGDMSVVGPRPHMVNQTYHYSSVIERYMLRHAVKPGITGWAQVNGRRGATSSISLMEERVRLDIWYIKNWNFFLDLKIVWLTIVMLVRGDENAY